MRPPFRLAGVFPFLEWIKRYNADTFASDMLATAVVCVVLIPQSLAYAMLAGLPPQMGLYAGILPPVLYALFGSSRIMAVGPTAIISLMTASTASAFAAPGSADYINIALVMAMLSGIMLLVMGLLRLGRLTNFISRPVISGFMTASTLVIAISQLKYLLGIDAKGDEAPAMLLSLYEKIQDTNIPTLLLALLTMGLIFFTRVPLRHFLAQRGASDRMARIVSRTGALLAVLACTGLALGLNLTQAGVKIVGTIPQNLPPLALPNLDLGNWSAVLGAAFLIALISFVESISIAQSLAAKRKERVEPDKELIALGTANMMASFAGGYPVAGSFSRSAIKYDAGAETQAANLFTALAIALVALYLTPLLYHLPRATLAATIVIAIVQIADFGAFKKAWRFSRRDFFAMLATVIVTFFYGVENGLIAGIGFSLALHVYYTSHPHFTLVGLLPGTQSFRGTPRHDVVLSEKVLSLRIDESLYFANARFLEDTVYNLIAEQRDAKALVLMCTAVNHIDTSALESLEILNRHLKANGITLHLSEVKTQVLDRLGGRSGFLDALSGEVFLTHYDAIKKIDPDVIARAVSLADIPSI